MNITQIYRDLQNNLPNLIIKQNENMACHTSFKIGGNADIWIKVATTQELKYILQYTKQKKIPLNILGNGSNVLVKDNGIRGITLQLDLNQIEIEKEEENVEITVGAGVKLGMLAVLLQKQEITGFEFARSEFHGTIGGAIRMNAGAYGREMQEIVQEVTYMDEDGNVKSFQGSELNFSYRHSRFKEEQAIIIGAKLQLQKGNAKEIKEKMDTYRNLRKEKQPIDMPSAGSTFKRGKNFISAQLIDEAGLKGYTIGGAQVSKKHAGFIVNTGNATAQDVLELIDYVVKVVYEKFGKILELELEVIGE